MSKKTVTKTTRPLSPKPAVKRARTAYPVEPEDLDEQQQRVRRAAAAGAGALKPPTPATMTEQPPAPAAVPPKPLAPLAALWPSAAPQGPAPQKPPVAVSTPKASPAAAPPSAKPPAQSAPPLSPEKPAVIARAQKPTAPKPVHVSFALRKPTAKHVSVCGEFNAWSPSATVLQRHDDGHWETTVALAPGRYQYKFLVDGEWLLDPAAQKSVSNEYGSLNSVIEVRP